MPRILSKPDDLSDPAEMVIRARRGGKLLNLDRQLLYSPPFAQGWSAMLAAVRTELSLPGVLREIAICAVATINQASYEFDHHAPLIVAEGGSQAQVDALRDVDAALERADLFDATELAVIRLTREMTRSVEVSDATFDDARVRLGSERHTIELVGVIATYNMVSRFLVALEVEHDKPAEQAPS